MLYVPLPSLPFLCGYTDCGSLAAVNFFLACTGTAQLTRIFLWRRSQDGSAREAVKDMAADTIGSAKLVTDSAKGAVKAAEENVKSS